MNARTFEYIDIPGGSARKRPITVCVHSFYEEITTQGFLFHNANVSIGQNLLKPWCDLYRYGKAHGIHFVTADQVEDFSDIDAVLFSDRPSAHSQLASRLLALPVPKYLQLCETEVIKPDNWDRAYHAQFRKVFTMLDDWVDHVRYIKTFHVMDPVMVGDVALLKTQFATRKLCTLIAGAKLTRHAHELYSARIETIQWMQAHAPDDFDLYGFGWSQAQFPSYRGTTDNKLSTLGGYRFAICYENARNFPGYITEKLFDCLIAGTIPVYWGAPNIGDWVPSGCYIDRTRFASDAEMYAHLKSMGEEEHGAYLDRIAAFIQSGAVYPFTTENFITTISSHIAKDVKEVRGEAPLVSVCIPNYNYGRFLRRAVESALEQDVEELEVLVFDNASTDESMEVLEPFRHHPQVRIMRNSRNYGSNANWYCAFRVASGKYLTVLSADDYFLPAHLAPKLRVMEQRPELSLAYCPCMQVDFEGTARGVSLAYGHPDQDYLGGRDEVSDLLTYDCYITPSAAVMRRSAFEALGWITESRLHGAGDWNIWIRLAERFPDFAYFRDAQVCYRVHTAQDTQQLLQSAHFLEDHIFILRSVLERGNSQRLADHATEIAALLWGRFYRSPQEFAQAHLPTVAQLEVQLLNLFLGRHANRLTDAGQREALLQLFKQSLQDAAPLVDVMNMAQSLQDQGHSLLASALYRCWITHSSSPVRHAGAYNLAVAMDQAGNPLQALMYYGQALALQPEFDQARLALAHFCLRRKRPDVAAFHLSWLLDPAHGTQSRNPSIAQEAAALLQSQRDALGLDRAPSQVGLSPAL